MLYRHRATILSLKAIWPENQLVCYLGLKLCRGKTPSQGPGESLADAYLCFHEASNLCIVFTIMYL
jgi:hypothetical protein